MTKQQLAQKRNWFKFQMTGMLNRLNSIDIEYLSTIEQYNMTLLKSYINNILINFDESSINLGLNVPNKCWCNKPVFKNLQTCKNHNNE